MSDSGNTEKRAIVVPRFSNSSRICSACMAAAPGHPSSPTGGLNRMGRPNGRSGSRASRTRVKSIGRIVS